MSGTNEWTGRMDQALAPSPVNARLALKGEEAAKLCGLCEKSLYLAVRKGELRCVKIGRAVRYRLEDLQAWIDGKVR